jgi:hypothetical protein
MLDRKFLRPILDDESLTRGLGDEEARLLIEWLVERAENLAASSLAERTRRNRLNSVCQRGRAIGRFVRLWCHDHQAGAATQLAGAEAFSWDLPHGDEDAAELMARILRAEQQACMRAA